MILYYLFRDNIKGCRQKVDSLSGGDGGIRTLDLTDANRTLSQLSYTPKTGVIIAHLGVFGKSFL